MCAENTLSPCHFRTNVETENRDFLTFEAQRVSDDNKIIIPFPIFLSTCIGTSDSLVLLVGGQSQSVHKDSIFIFGFTRSLMCTYVYL